MSIFSDFDLEAEASKIKQGQHYEQDLSPDSPERSAPITETERQALDSRMADDRSDPFANWTPIENEGPLTEWVPPKVRQQQRQAAMLPKMSSIKAQEDRLHGMASIGGQPEELVEAIASARKACQEAYATLDAARHPDAPSRPKNPKAKQAAIDAIEAAKVAVDAAEAVFQRDDIILAQRETLAQVIEPARLRAAEALAEAAAAFAEWQDAMEQVRELDIVTGAYDAAWHQHKDERSVNPRALIGDLRRARDLANSEHPFWSGDYLVNDPTPEGELPEWTAERLQSGSEFDTSVLWRMKQQHPEDVPAHKARALKSLGVIYTSPVPVLHSEGRRR